MSYSQEYIHFIKTFLVNACYMEYCKEVYNKIDIIPDYERQTYKYNLLDYKNEKYIWDNVFNKLGDMFMYYLHLSVDHTSILNLHKKENYSQNRLSTIYEQVTFQDFIDEHVNFQKIGYREYQNFVKSMKMPDFKNKMIEKYYTDSAVRTLKNHLVYIVNLHISKQINIDTMFSDEEINDMDIIINSIPFFEQLSINNWTIEKIETETIHNTANSMKMANFYTIEETTLRKIINSF